MDSNGEYPVQLVIVLAESTTYPRRTVLCLLIVYRVIIASNFQAVTSQKSCGEAAEAAATLEGGGSFHMVSRLPTAILCLAAAPTPTPRGRLNLKSDCCQGGDKEGG
jgi:hypothetical protein